MKLIITRHGETEENKAGIIQGHLPGKLPEEGIVQAQKVAARLKDEKIDVIYTSDLARTFDTAKEIAKYHPDVPFHVTQALRERNLGEMQGKRKSDLGMKPTDFIATKAEAFPGAETNEEMYERAKDFLDEILPKHQGETVLLAGHNGINKALIAVLEDKEISDIENQHNTSVNVIEVVEGKDHQFHTRNCIKHLNTDL